MQDITGARTRDVDGLALREADLWTVPQLYPGQTIICLGAGQSLAAVDPKRLAGQVVLAANSAALWAERIPGAILWATLLDSFSARMWKEDYIRLKAKGARIVTANTAARNILGRDLCHLLDCPQERGLCTDRSGVAHGGNTGHMQVNLAWHLGPPRRIVMLGYDMRVSADGRSHWDGAVWDENEHWQYPQVYAPAFKEIAADLKAAGCEVLNATPHSALEAFPKISLDDLIL